MLVAGDFFIAMCKDRGNYNWKGRREKDRKLRTIDDGPRTMDHEARSFDDELKIADRLLRDYFTTTAL